eukprot:CAMPEP_0119353944 /NCGR_PEP_ID=MMETSP1334-20130426/3031_1 /TAXON_ID=127549 /ORGANISM="Calcidiscus leptoporus, Strain RCC1130" /LENGTH=176 /DNA_ID=CAMNT_0007367367 /DNA_START=24 /DNA_END=554 /DNA_ORIENTATION=+
MVKLIIFLAFLALTEAAKTRAKEPVAPETKAWLAMTPGLAAVVVLGHTLLTKLMMTIIWRGPGSKATKLGADNWMAVKAQLEKDPFYQIMAAVQLNEAEYAGPLAAALLFLSAAGAAAPIASMLAALGQPMYYWPRVFLADPKSNHNNGFPFYVPGALMRYAALGMMTYQIYEHVA